MHYRKGFAMRTWMLVPAALLVGSTAMAQPYGPPPPPYGPPPSRDMFCRHQAAAATGYTTPGEAASREQTNGSVGGLLAGGALGAIIGGAAGNAGLGAAAGAGAGLIAGSSIGSDNARQAARDVRHQYDGAYYDCMNQASNGPPPAPPPGYEAPPPPDDAAPPPPPDDRYPR
jgi:hypothetical protein